MGETQRIRERVRGRNPKTSQRLRVQLKIRIETDSRKLAKALAGALAPDNPTGSFNVKTRSVGTILICEIRGVSRLESMQSTSEDILNCLQALAHTLKGLAKA